MNARKWWVATGKEWTNWKPSAQTESRVVLFKFEDMGVTYRVSGDEYGIDVWCDDKHIGVADSMVEAMEMARDDAKGMMK